VITLAGLVALSAIPIAQYPNITPPQVSISITYPGASAQTIANTIAEPVEEQVNGAPGMLYMQSSEASSGTYSLTVTFAIGTDPNIDQVNVQNRVQVAEAQLAGGGAVRRYHRARRILHASAGGQPVFPLEQVQPALYFELHLYEAAADHRAAAGRGEHADLRAAAICHADLAESGEDDRTETSPRRK